MKPTPVLLWLRNDLRFTDNPAMQAAAQSGQPVICLYILDDTTPAGHALGGAQAWWLHQSLTAFDAALRERGGTLILRRGNPQDIVPTLAADIGAQAVYWNRRYAAWQMEVDTALKQTLTQAKIAVHSHNGALLHEPWEIATKSGTPYRVFTPYFRQILARDDQRTPLREITDLAGTPTSPPSDRLADWALEPTAPNWAHGIAASWTPGEAGAKARWRAWLHSADAKAYDTLRNRPDREGTSRMSPHLHFGEISPATLWHDMRAAMAAGTIPQDQGMVFLSELGWREFSYQLTFHHQGMEQKPLMEKFAHFRWDNDKAHLRAWQQGRTGYPIVDAGMRQLWQTGWMHNRVRMIVGSFLVKDLLVDWRQGLEWFWDTLVDADPASNTASWQWIAGCGADAAPFFRIFNPTTQGQKFDPDGTYVKTYVPELAGLPAKFIHEPAKAPPLILADAKVRLGDTYPHPVVDHGAARTEALARYQAIRQAPPEKG